ncbi:Innexin unc-7 [Lamellibrachia satsuma]|nr:Innexin unc-7 [Lamellibrachia satsuma]
MDKIVGAFGSVPQAASRNDDDFSDRLNHRYTTGLLILFAVIVSTKQYVGDPISCWVPAHFTGNHESYANDYCWVRNTYYLSFDEYIPKEHESDKRHMIPYYQWMPIILLLQALFFHLPIMVWRTLNRKSGIDVNNIVEAGESFQNAEKAANRDTMLEYMTSSMNRYLITQGKDQTDFTMSLKNCLSRTVCFMSGRRKGNYLISLYLVTKILFIINVVSQLFVLNHFLGTEYNLYGINVIQELLRGDDWTQSDRFPRVTMCDLKVRRLGNVQRYTVQCVLPINLFNEKIYLFLWFWMVFIATLSCLSLLTWTLRSMFYTDRRRYVKKHIVLMEEDDEDGVHIRDDNGRHFKTFMEDYLRQDGVFVLRLIGHNTNAITVTEFVYELWQKYRRERAEESDGSFA